MAFGIGAYEQNIRPTDAPQTGTSPVRGVDAVKAANAAALGDAREGQVVTGEVTGMNGKNVQLTLPDNRVVTARLETDLKLSVGQSLAFAVKSNTGDQIALRPLFNSEAVNATAIKALGQASILVNSDTLLMASAMMDEGLPISKDSIQAMFRQVNRFPDASAADIVSMSKLGIPLTDENVLQYGAYRNNEHQIMELNKELSQLVSDLAGELPLDAKGELTGIFNGNDFGSQLGELTKGLAGLVDDYEASLAAEAAGDDAVSVAEEGVILESTKEGVAADTDLNRLLNPDTRAQMADDLSKLGISEDILDSIKSGEMDPQSALKYIQGALELEKNGEIDKLNLPDDMKNRMHEAVRNLTSGKAFNELLKDSLIRDFSLKADGDFSKEKVADLYERMIRDTAKVSQLLDQFGKSDSPLAKGLDNLNQNINFMNQLNETFTYLQIPIQMSGENAHGDLYVMTNKKKLMEKDGEITALLHLEMEALGTMDIHVTLKDTNSVKTHFMLEDDATLDLISENIHLLNERLEARGYSMTSDVSIKDDDDKNKAITAMLGRAGEARGDRLISKYSFDVKA